VRRRDFLAASCCAGWTASWAGAVQAASEGHRHFFEFRQYSLLPGPKKGRFNAFLRQAMIPALNRLGIGPVGVFFPKYGPNKPTLFLLLPHPSLESVLTLAERLLADKEFCEAGAEVVDAPLADPAYLRVESSLLVAFDELPTLQIPSQTKEGKPRIFELRTYESHSIKAGKKKIEMFNKGGEIAIFKKTGLQPVFFAETIIGRAMPNLTYMLAFDDMAARDAAWKNFITDPDWEKLKADPQYKDTVSNITDVILRPAPYSQV